MTDQHDTDPAATRSTLAEPQKDALAEQWNKTLSKARKHWGKYHRRVQHNRKLVAGFDWQADPTSSDFYTKRANLIHGTITAILPNIYARNPEISVSGRHKGRDVKLLARTIEKVTNTYLEGAQLKTRAKSTVRAALTCSIGVVKVLYQKEKDTDALIQNRIPDSQDNIDHAEHLASQAQDASSSKVKEAAEREMQETVAGLMAQAEVKVASGLVIDRVLTEHFIMDPSIAEFWDYEHADWLAQLIPMRRSKAEALYKVKLDRAKTYQADGEESNASKTASVMSGEGQDTSDPQICVVEIWDRRTLRVYTLAEGCDYFLRDPFTPDAVGERWYPFFALPFQTVDGQVIGPSLVDLCEKLEAEHNAIREKEKSHRDAIKPGWFFDRGDMKKEDVERIQNAAANELTGIDGNGKPLNAAIMPKTYPPLDPALYDTSKVRYDWEQVSGMQDAARSSVVQPKTATEASIMQQNLSGRVSEFRDQVEDFVRAIAQYAAEILLQELTEDDVRRIMGEHKMGPVMQAVPDPMTGAPMEVEMRDPMTGEVIIGVIEAAYDWPQLTRDQVFDLIELKIRAGTTGEPDKIDQQETMAKLLPVLQPLIKEIMQYQLQGIDTTALETLAKEAIARFDDKMDVDAIIPKLKPQAPPMPPQGMPGPPPNELLQKIEQMKAQGRDTAPLEALIQETQSIPQ